MASGSYSYEVVGMYQDITDIVVNISPDETPFLTMFGQKPAEATTVTSLNDALPTADSTPIVEGSDVLEVREHCTNILLVNPQSAKI